MKKLLLRYIVLIGLLCCLFGQRGYGQTPTFTVLGDVNGLSPTSTAISSGRSQVVVYGFTAAVASGSLTYKQFNLSWTGSSNVQTRLTNGSLIRFPAGTNYSVGGGVPIGNVTFNNQTITVADFTETITNTSYNYYLVADAVYNNAITTDNNGQIFSNSAPPAGIAVDVNNNVYGSYLNGYRNYTFTNGIQPYPISITNQTTSLAATTTVITPNTLAAKVFSFNVKNNSVATPYTFSAFRIGSNQTNLSLYFNNFKLYVNTTNTFPGTAPIQTIASSTSGFVNFTGITAQTINAGSTLYFWLVADSPTGATPGSVQFEFNTQQSPAATTSTSPSASLNTFTATGPLYTLNTANIAVANNTNGLSGTSPTAGQTGIAMFGFAVTSPAAATTVAFSGFNINSTNANVGTYFTAKLFRQTGNSTYPNSPVQVGTVTFNNTYANVVFASGSYETISAGQTIYYFLVADNINAITPTQTVQFGFSSGQTQSALIQATPAVSNYNLYTFSGNTYNIPNPGITITGLNTTGTGSGGNNITNTIIAPGSSNIALYGFKLTAVGNNTLKKIAIPFTTGNEDYYFQNGKIYQSADDIYSSDDVSVGTVNFGQSALAVTSLTSNIAMPNGTVLNFFIVADAKVFTPTAPPTNRYGFTTGQTYKAINGDDGSLAINPTSNIPGATLNFPAPGSSFVWNGSQDNNSANQYNWNTQTAPSAATNDVYFPAGCPRYPILMGGANTIGNVYFTGNGANINLNGLQFSPASINVTANVSASFGGTGTLTPTGPVNTLRGSTLSFTAPMTMPAGTATAVINNAGTINLTGAGALVMANTTASANSVNSGTITQGGTGALTFGGAFTNTGVITQSSTGTFTVSGALTNTAGDFITQTGTGVMNFSSTINNSGTINKTSTGTINVTGAATNNSGGIISNTGASGAITFSNTLNNSGALNPTNGPITLNGNFTNNSTGVVTLGAGILTLAAAGTTPTNAGSITGSGSMDINSTTSFTNSGSMTMTGGNVSIASPTFSNTSTGTVIPTGGTISFDGTTQAINNANTATPVTFYNLTLGTSGTKTLNNPNTNTGLFEVAPAGLITLSGTANFNANTSLLTLNSDANNTASVAILPAGNTISGVVTVERYLTGGNRVYKLMGSPVNASTNTALAANSTTATTARYNFTDLKTNLIVTGTGGNSNGFDGASDIPGYTVNGATILTYNTLTDNFTPLSNLSNTVAVGSSFYFYYRGNRANPATKVIRPFATPESTVGLQVGTLNQQSFRYTLTNTGKGYNLVSNPYPSNITIGSSALSGTNNTIYTYSTGSSINAHSVSSGTWGLVSGQGFVVKTAATGPYYITFTESLKTPTASVPLLLATSDSAPDGNITLQMFQDSVNYDLAQLRFADKYKKDYDELEDADDLNGSGQVVFFGAMAPTDHLVAIASQPIEKQRTSVFLSVNDNTSGLFSIKRMDLSNIPAVYDVWLMDHFKKDSLDLRVHDNYNFNIDKANTATFGNSRFEVVIRKKALPPYKLLNFAGNKSTTGNLLDWNTLNEYDYTSFELQKSTDGKNFETIQFMQSASLGSYNYKDINIAKQDLYYRLKQTDINDQISYSNVVIIVSTQGNGSLNIFPNPATNSIQFSLNEKITSSVSLRIFNSMGILMKSSTFTAATGQQDITSLTPGSYTIELIDLQSKKLLLTGKFIKI